MAVSASWGVGFMCFNHKFPGSASLPLLRNRCVVAMVLFDKGKDLVSRNLMHLNAEEDENEETNTSYMMIYQATQCEGVIKAMCGHRDKQDADGYFRRMIDEVVD